MKSVNFAKSVLVTSLVLASHAFAQSAAPAAEATPPLTFNISLTSNYKFRGQDQFTSKTRAFKPALNGGFDYAFDNGFYVGNWNSTIDWTKNGLPSRDNSSLEVDLYGGYKFKAGELDMDVGALQYYYPGATGANTTELYLAGTYGPVTAKYSGTVSKGYFGLGKEFLPGQGRGTGYFNLAYAQEVAPKTTLKAAMGYTSYKSGAKDAGIPNYIDYSVGAAYDLGDGFTLNGAVQGGNKKSSYLYAIDPSKSINRATLVVTVTKAL